MFNKNYSEGIGDLAEKMQINWNKASLGADQ